MARSQGDPRVLLLMNFVLSALLSYTVVWGLDFIGELAFSWESVAIGTLALMTLTFIVVH